ncbi:MAG TPA: YIP1 family protein [Bacteroidota bacterium]|nr:YIP1 family protein [Bacteroidota bacterium]
MDEVNTTQPPSEEGAQMSFTDKLMNVFSAPGELFESVAKSEKQNSNWSIPLVLSMLISVVFVLAVFSQQPIQDQIRDQTEKSIEKRVAEGKMTQEQADMAMSKNPAQPGSPLFMIFGSVGALIFVAITLFGLALVFWLAGKWVFKSAATYSKVLEVVGLSMYISALMAIVTLLLVMAMGSLYATPSLALAVSHYDPMDKLDKFLGAVNIGTFWFLAIVAIGLAKLFSVTTVKTMTVMAVLWALWTAVTVFAGFGM